MTILKALVQRLTTKRHFYYGWEERAFERRLEQTLRLAQFTCRFNRD